MLQAVAGPSVLHAGDIVQIEPGLSGYMAQPSNPDHKVFPVVLLLPEWHGLNSQMMVLADDFARDGFAALALDLYGGRVAQNPYEAGELMRSLPETEALAKVKKALEFLRRRAPYLPANFPLRGPYEPGIDGRRIAVVGWSMGGGLAVRIASLDADIRAAVVYYGKLPDDDGELSKLKAPVLGFFAGKDPSIDAVQIDAFERRMEMIGKNFKAVIYPEEEHAFMDWHTAAYRPEAARKSWEEMRLFLKARLS